MLPDPVDIDGTEDDDEMAAFPENAPIFPHTLLAVDCRSGVLFTNALIEDYERDAGMLVAALAHTMQENGLPAVLQVRDKRTESLLRGFAGQTGAALVINNDLPLLDEAEDELLDQFDAENPGEGDVEGLFEMIMALDDASLRSAPPELRRQLLELEAQGVLPPEFAARLRKLFR
jgi:hypothetical protein